MIVAERHLEKLTEVEVASIRDTIRKNRTVRLSLPSWGWLYVDRRLPFLFMHRSPAERRTFGTELLTLSESCALVIPEDEDQTESQRLLLDNLVDELSDAGEFLIVELSSTEVTDVEKPSRPLPVPEIEIQGNLDRDQELIRTFSEAFEATDILDQSPTIRQAQAVADGLGIAERADLHYLRLVLSPIWVNPETRDPFPMVLRDLREEMSVALKKAAWSFCRNHTSLPIMHFDELGRQEVLEEDWLVDQELSRISSRFQFLLDITPVNPRAAYREFEESGWKTEPQFHYRRLSYDPERSKGDLYRVPVDDVEDPTLHHLFREKRAELARTMTMLEQRNSSDFLYSSLQQYGPVTDRLLELALDLLEALPVKSIRTGSGRGVDADGFAKIARQEIQAYQHVFPGMSSRVEILPEITNLMVSRGNLLVPVDLFIPEGRINALLHHEVGTHIVTWANGKSQRLSQLHTGFAGYDELQEGLAVLAEYLVGELSVARMRLLAGRVVAVRRLIEGESFPDIFSELRGHGFTDQQSFTISMRVWRSGGLTKDAVYLRGLVRLLEYLASGGDLDLLFIGKITEAHVDLVQELRRRRILREPPLRPRYLDMPESIERLENIRRGASLLDLIRKEN